MTQEERIKIADKLAAEYTLLLDFTRTITVLIGLLPLLYGVLTWIYGEVLWTDSVVYGTALAVPYAPQSWGVSFILLGSGTIVSARMGRRRCIAIFTMGTALIMAMFMVTFLTEVLAHDKPSALPPALVYGVVSLLFMTRARLAWSGRRALHRHGLGYSKDT